MQLFSFLRKLCEKAIKAHKPLFFQKYGDFEFCEVKNTVIIVIFVISHNFL